MNKKAFLISVVLFAALIAMTLYAYNLDSAEPSTVPESAAPEASADMPESATETPQPAPSVTPEPAPEAERITPRDRELVRVGEFIPDILVELRYASDNNFTGASVYDFTDAWLRYGTVKKLAAAQEALNEQGLALKIWDAYRPSAAQFTLWEAMPDGNFIANPYTGHSGHSSGATVDITLVDSKGKEAEMPSGFDEFSSAADRDYSDVSQKAAENALLLDKVMSEAGFVGYYGEWWHYSDAESYTWEDLESIKLPRGISQLYEPECNEYISLRSAPDYSADVLELILKGERFTVLGWLDDFARVEYKGRQGYVARAYIKSAEN